jgi:hypothetical protein
VEAGSGNAPVLNTATRPATISTAIAWLRGWVVHNGQERDERDRQGESESLFHASSPGS